MATVGYDLLVVFLDSFDFLSINAVLRVILFANLATTSNTAVMTCSPLSTYSLMTLSTVNVVSPAASVLTRISCTFLDHDVGITSSLTRLGPAPVSKNAFTILDSSWPAKVIVISSKHLPMNNFAFPNTAVQSFRRPGYKTRKTSVYSLLVGSLCIAIGANVTLFVVYGLLVRRTRRIWRVRKLRILLSP